MMICVWNRDLSSYVEISRPPQLSTQRGWAVGEDVAQGAPRGGFQPAPYDMKILGQVSTDEDACRLQDDLDRFHDYCARNKLDLNVSKCYVCTFTRKPNPVKYNYKISSTLLARVSVIRDLGVTFDSKLLFDVHINNIVNKASKALGFIYRISSDFKNIKTMKILYCAFVRSHLEYASQIWNPIYNVYVNRIESIQRRFMRFIQYRSKIYLPNYLSRCKKKHILPLNERRKIADLAFLFSVMNGCTDVPELVGKVGLRVPCAFLRHARLLHVPKVETTYRQNSYMIRVCRTFNAVCRDVDLDLFDTKIRNLKTKFSKRFFDM